MIKVAIVLNSAWQGYNFRLNLARELKRSNYEVVFVAPDDGEYSHKLKKEFSFEDVDLKAASINPINDLRLCISLFKVYKKIKPNIVLNFTIKPNIYSAIVARILKIDSINNITGQGTVFIKKTFVTQIVKLLYKVSLLCTSFIFFQNSDDRNFFIDKKLVTLKKSDILPGSGVDTNKFCQVVRKDDKVFRFLMVARIIRDKGINEFIEAAKELNKNGIEFWVLGKSGSHNRTAISINEITKLSKDGVVSFFERTDDVKSFLEKVDCVVLPSYGEGCPRSIMEASSSGIPVIVSDVPGCRDVVDNNITGLYCKVRDNIDLARKMQVIFEMSKNDRVNMGQMGRLKMLNQYDESIVLDKYKKQISEIFSQ